MSSEDVNQADGAEAPAASDKATLDNSSVKEPLHSSPSIGSNTASIPSISEQRCSSPESNRRVTRPVLRSATLDRSRPKMRKRVSFAKPEYLLHLEDSKTAQGCLLSMQRGSILTKVRQRGMFIRYFHLSDEMNAICWQSTRKENGMGRIEVGTIHEIRHGRHSELLRSLDVQESDDCIFTVVHSTDFQCMDLIAETPEVATIWVMGLQYLLNMSNPPATSPSTKEKPIRELWLEELFIEADTNKDGFLDQEEIVQLCYKHNIGLSEEAIRKKFGEADTNRVAESRGRLDRDEFRDFYMALSTRPEVVYLVGQYGNSDVLTPEQLLVFIKTEQRIDDATVEDCQEIIQEFEPTPMGKAENHLTVDGFTRYLRSPHGDIFRRAHVSVNHDMSQPLSHYFVSSSHNTYLTQSQSGPVEAMGITRALHRGCRLIDLDIWNGPSYPIVSRTGEAGDPAMPLATALDAVRDACFKVSHYPLFLRLEVHCSVEQQRMIVELVKTKLDKYVYTGTVDDKTAATLSPEACKEKVFLVGKKLSTGQSEDDEGDVSEEEDEDLQYNDMMEPPPAAGSKKVSRAQSSSLFIAPQPPAQNQTSMRLCRELSDLMHFSSAADKGFSDDIFERVASTKMVALSEPRIQQYSMNWSERLLLSTKTSLARAYPAVTRPESSNMDPMAVWSRGIQCVAMNCQTIGKPMDMNEGMFKANGYAGYYLKPQSMRADCGFVSYRDQGAPVPGIAPLDMSVKVISGQMLPKPANTENRTEVIDPYVVVEVEGVESDRASYRTRPIENNGFNPVWDETCSFHLRFPDMAMLRFVVLDADAIGSDFIAQFCIPLSSVESGYRHVHLISNVHHPIPNASLFVHITINKDRPGRRIASSAAYRKKAKKEAIALQQIGNKDLDAHFKKFTPLLSQAAGLSYDADFALSTFKDSCGLSGWTTMYNCVRSLVNRCRVGNTTLTLQMVEELFPSFAVSGGDVPDPVKKAGQALTQGVPAFRALLSDAAKVAEELKSAYEESLPMLKTVQTNFATLGERKAQKALESFSFNCLSLKTEADELLRAQTDVTSSLKQITLTASLLGVKRDS